MATVMNIERVTELASHPERMINGEVETLCLLARQQLVDDDVHSNWRASLDAHKDNLRQCAAKLADSDRLRKLTAMDLGASETHCQSLIRRLQDALANAERCHRHYDHFIEGVHNCIHRLKLPPEVASNPALLRLQEALESAHGSKNDA